jgi:regulator of protease activity HflC (stomatin/prohibitin superfamily)
MGKIKVLLGVVLVLIVITALIVPTMFTTIKPGHVGVGTVFGSVQQSVYNEGFNWKSPWVSITSFDARQKSYKDTMGVPSKDQLTTDFDLSVQYRLIASMAPEMMRETGTPEDVVNIHMVPYMRSLMREIGKSVKRAEDFFDQTEQTRVQNELFTALDSTLTKKGIKIEKLLIRDVRLPDLITDAVEAKKEVAQAAEKAKEELKKFKVDQERREAEAEARKRAEIIEAQKKAEVAKTVAEGDLVAARINAESTIVLAEAQAAAVKKQIDVLGLTAYVKLKTAEVLPMLAAGNHLILMDPEGSNMLPFMDMSKMTGATR